MPILFIASFVTFIIGLYFGLKSKSYEGKFIIYLVIGLVFATPLMISGYTWYDEIYAAGLLLGSFRIKKKINFGYADILFLFLIFYMIIQAFRGIYFFYEVDTEKSVQKFRWVIFFLLVLIIFIVIKSQNSYRVTYVDSEKYFFKTACYFSLVYFLIGICYLFISGNQFHSQYAGNDYGFLAATAYVAVIFYILVPLILLCILSSLSKKNKNLSSYILIILLMIGLSFFYKSRSGLFSILFLTFFFFFSKRLTMEKKIKFLFFLLILTTLICLLNYYFNFYNFDEIIKFKFLDKHEDQDRKILNYAAFIVIQENPINFLFGSGFRTSGYMASPLIHDLYISDLNLKSHILNKYESLTGFAALLIDIGVFGIVLIMTLIFLAIIKLHKNNYPLFYSLIPLTMFMQLFVINMIDIMLLYFIIMPNFIGQLFPANQFILVKRV